MASARAMQALARLPTQTGRGTSSSAAQLARVIQARGGNRALARLLADRGRPQAPGTGGRVLARSLLATGDVAGFRALVEPVIGMKLDHDPLKKVVTPGGALPDPPTSPALRDQLTEIMKPGQDAEVQFGNKVANVGIGSFPGGDKEFLGGTVQIVDLADIEAIERDMPGHGIGALTHEIVENYWAHSQLPGQPGVDVFTPAHDAAIEAQNKVLAELVGGGGRIGQRTTPNEIIIDFEHYFVIHTLAVNALPGGGQDVQVTGSKEKALDPINEYVIDDFPVDSDALPPGGAAMIAAAEADLIANGRSTAVVAGYTDSNGSGADNERLSRQRARSVRDLFALNLQKSAGPVGRGETDPVGDNATEAGRRRNRRVVIRVRRPRP